MTITSGGAPEANCQARNGRAGVMLTGTCRPVTGSRGSRGPGRTRAAVEGTLEDLEGHHLAQGPPDSHCTVSLPWASQVNGSCWFKVLPATGTWMGSRRAGEQSFWVGHSQQAWAGGFQAGEGEWGEARSLLGSGEGHHHPGHRATSGCSSKREAVCTVVPSFGRRPGSDCETFRLLSLDDKVSLPLAVRKRTGFVPSLPSPSLHPSCTHPSVSSAVATGQPPGDPHREFV